MRLLAASSAARQAQKPTAIKVSVGSQKRSLKKGLAARAHVHLISENISSRLGGQLYVLMCTNVLLMPL